MSACGRFRRNGTPAPGLAASASSAHRASARCAARTLCSADILGVCIYAVGGESCRIRARPEAVRSAVGGEIARAWRVLALGPADRALIALSGRAPRLLPRHPRPIRVAWLRRGIPRPRHARASARLPRTGRPPPPCVRSSASPSDPDPTIGGSCLVAVRCLMGQGADCGWRSGGMLRVRNTEDSAPYERFRTQPEVDAEARQAEVGLLSKRERRNEVRSERDRASIPLRRRLVHLIGWSEHTEATQPRRRKRKMLANEIVQNLGMLRQHKKTRNL